MKVLLALFAVMAAVVAVLALTVVQIVIKLAPILVLIAVAVVVIKAVQARRHPHPPARPALPPARRMIAARTPPPARPVGWAPQAPGGWVLLPVWMGPPPVAWQPTPTVVDAEVIEDDRRG
jgi:hypothetical protein